MRLRDLDIMLLKYVSPKERRIVSTLAEADGIMFQCPKCAQNAKPGQEGDRRFFYGVHYVICWFVGHVPDDTEPKPGRWTPSGAGIDDLTFVPGNPPRAKSVLLTGPGCGWHGYIKNGEATLE